MRDRTFQEIFREEYLESDEKNIANYAEWLDEYFDPPIRKHMRIRNWPTIEAKIKSMSPKGREIFEKVLILLIELEKYDR